MRSKNSNETKPSAKTKPKFRSLQVLMGFSVLIGGFTTIAYMALRSEGRREQAFDQVVTEALTKGGFDITGKNIDYYNGITTGIYKMQRHDSLFTAVAKKNNSEAGTPVKITNITFTGKTTPTLPAVQ